MAAKPRFETWLRTQGLFQQADRWRHRAAWEQARHTPSAPQRTAQRAEAMRELEDFRRYADAVNAERYRVTCIKMDEDGGKKTFILDRKGGMTRGFSPGRTGSAHAGNVALPAARRKYLLHAAVR